MFAKIQKMLRNRKGFTLIELIVVIAILGVLATIAIPNISGLRQKAVDGRTDANREIVERAAAMWLAENGAPAADNSEEWTGAANENWGDYLDEWPEGIDKVVIDKDGEIKVDLDNSDD